MEVSNPVTRLTDKEREDTVDMSTLDINKRMDWNKKVEAFMQKMTEQGKPFCHHCAIRSYDEYRSSLQKKAQRILQMGGSVEINPGYKCDLSQFCKTMKFINESIKNDRRIVAGTPVFVPVYYQNYRCSECNGGHSIESDKSVKTK